MSVGICASIAARPRREGQLAQEFENLADAIQEYGASLQRKYQIPGMVSSDPLEWPKIVNRYNREYGRQAARLVRELWTPEYKDFAKSLTKPDSIGQFFAIADTLLAIGSVSPGTNGESTD
jgi:hypothetical protein